VAVVNIGVLGGTFDPVHLGHLIIAEEVRDQFKLDRVLFVPSGHPWLKDDRVITPAGHRVSMLRLALASNPRFQISMVDVERGGPSYTVDTLADLRRQFGESASFFFIMGWDSLKDLHLWKDPARIIQQCRLVAVGRPGSTKPRLSALETTLPGISKNVLLLPKPLIGISSSEIRQRVANGLSIKYLVPEAVETYIRENGLYLT
jgi:nicotinate-nucleotide adenylyltransferase